MATATKPGGPCQRRRDSMAQGGGAARRRCGDSVGEEGEMRGNGVGESGEGEGVFIVLEGGDWPA